MGFAKGEKLMIGGGPWYRNCFKGFREETTGLPRSRLVTSIDSRNELW